MLGPADPPSSYAEADRRKLMEQMDRAGRLQDDTPLSFYPTDDRAAAYTLLEAGSSVEITGSLTSDDGELWYRTADGDHLPASAVAFPGAPSAPAVTLAARAPVGSFRGTLNRRGFESASAHDST